MTSKYDKELGLDSPITRRDFLYGLTFVAGGLLSGCANAPPSRRLQDDAYSFTVGNDWYGPGGSGDYASSHGNTPDLVQSAHRIRTGEFRLRPRDAVDTNERYDLIVIGAGFAGLGAAHHHRRLAPESSVLVLDNHPIFGGEAKRNDFIVNGVRVSGPQGSNDTSVQRETGGPEDYFTALGIPRDLRYAEPEGDAAGMRIPFDNYEHLHWHEDKFDVGHFFDGAPRPWVRDAWNAGLSQTPWSDSERAAFRRLRETEIEEVDGRDTMHWLDSMTMRDYYENVLGMPPIVSQYYDPIMASIIGLGCDAISAHWGNYFQIPGFRKPDSYASAVLHSFPGGNAAIARFFVKNLVPAAIEGERFEDVLFGRIDFSRLDAAGQPVRLRQNATVVRVENDGDGVQVFYLHGGRLHRTRARNAVMATGGWVNKHVIADLPQGHRKAYESFTHSPVLVANVALTNWRFLVKLGISSALWTGGFGFACNIRRPMIVGSQVQPLHPDQPIVMTFYVPIFKPGLPNREQGIAGRAELLGTSFAEYERRLREQMMRMFANGGFDPAADIAGIVLNRWGHAYVNPGPGFMTGTNGNPAPPDVIREPVGRIAIGHSELRGHQYWTGAAGEGRRAVEALLDA